MLASSIEVRRLGPDYFVVVGWVNGVKKTIPLDRIMLDSLVIRATESADGEVPNVNGLRERKNARA